MGVTAEESYFALRRQQSPEVHKVIDISVLLDVVHALLSVCVLFFSASPCHFYLQVYGEHGHRTQRLRSPLEEGCTALHCSPCIALAAGIRFRPVRVAEA